MEELPLVGTDGKEAPHLTYLRCRVRAGGENVTVFNAHLLSPREGLAALRGLKPGGLSQFRTGAGDRLRQAETLARAVRDEPGPVILAGDLNAPPPSLVCRTLDGAGLRDAFAVAGRGYGFTYGHALRPGLSFARLDAV